MENNETNCFSVIVGNVVIGIDLPIKKAQKIAKRAIKKFGINMVVIANQKYIDIKGMMNE